MATPAGKPKEANRQCPECEADVKLTIDADTGDREGRCSGCGLDVGAAVNRHRANKAMKKLADEEGEKTAKPPKESWF